jgi:hypothetical protein
MTMNKTNLYGGIGMLVLEIITILVITIPNFNITNESILKMVLVFLVAIFNFGALFLIFNGLFHKKEAEFY